MKYKKHILVFILLFFLFSCSVKPPIEIRQSEVKEIKISHFERFGFYGDDNFKLIKDEGDIKTIINIISKSKPISGDVDMPNGDYNIILVFNDDSEQAFHLWLSDEINSNGNVMDINRTADAYTMSKRHTKKMQNILFE